MANFRTAGGLACNRGFSMIELLVVMAIAAILAAGAGQLIGASFQRTQTIQYQAHLQAQIESLWAKYQREGAFPTTVAPFADADITLSSCGDDCRMIRLTPNRAHRCEYWTLTTRGERDAGHSACW